MSEISEVVAQAPVAAFAVDEKLRIVAWNRAAEQGLGVTAAQVLGNTCYEMVHAVDADSGRPCSEHCPLVDDSHEYGWAHSRVLKARWRGGRPVQLDCLLLRCTFPSEAVGSLSFITPLGVADAKRHLRALSAIEALYPIMTRSADVTRNLRSAVRAMLQATNAQIAELALLDTDTGEPFQVIREGLEPQHEAQLEGWPKIGHLSGFVPRFQGVLIGYYPPVDTANSGASGVWQLTIPLVAEERLLGTLSIGTWYPRFNVASAARVLFAVGGQLSVFLHWALQEDQQKLQSDRSGGPPQVAAARFYCFGQFRVVLNGQEVPGSHFRRQKSLALLKMLVAHRGRPLHREALIEFLWPEADPAAASNNLRVVLHDLRHGLELGLARGQASSYVLSRGDQIYLDPSRRCWSDVEGFEILAKKYEGLLNSGAAEAALKAGQEAVTLYTGAYLEDEPYVDWCIAERERLLEVYVNLLQKMALMYKDFDRTEEAIGACRAALAADPVKEDIHRQLIALLWRAGRRDEALRQYQVCQRTLWQELEVLPDTATQSLFQTILGQRSGSP